MNKNNTAVVLFSVDTTDLSREKQICRITAICNNNKFDQYILPNKNFTPITSVINGFQIIYFEDELRLVHNMEVVDAVPPKIGLRNFLDFLRRQTDGQVVLAAHECFKFGGSTIVREMYRHNILKTFRKQVKSFVDTASLFKTKLQKKRSYSLINLAEDYIGTDLTHEKYAKKVNILKELITKIGITDQVILEHAINIDEYIRSMPECVDARVKSLRDNLADFISEAMLKKIAKKGINYEILMNVYRKKGHEGIEEFLQEKVDGKPPITRSKKIIRNIIEGLAESMKRNR